MSVQITMTNQEYNDFVKGLKGMGELNEEIKKGFYYEFKKEIKEFQEGIEEELEDEYLKTNGQKMPSLCDPPCEPYHHFIGQSWWKRAGFSEPCGCAVRADVLKSTDCTGAGWLKRVQNEEMTTDDINLCMAGDEEDAHEHPWYFYLLMKENWANARMKYTPP